MKKRAGEAAIAAAVGAGLLAVAAAVWTSNRLGAAAAALCGAGALLYAALGCRQAPCPGCGTGVLMDAADAYVRCPGCRRYARATKEGLDPLPDDFSAEAPVFAIPFKEGLALPPVCCVCSRPATRRTTLGAKLENTLPDASIGASLKKNALLGAGLRPLIEVGVALPHCGEHPAEAGILIEPGEIGFAGGEDSRLVVRVRSYACYRAAIQL